MLQKITQIVVIIGLAMVIAGCPKTELTEYRLIPPIDEKGQQCIQICQDSQDQCERQCAPEGYECMKKAKKAFIHYQDQKALTGEKATQSIHDFYRMNSCTVKDCRCIVDYRSCFEMCGGAVVAG